MGLCRRMLMERCMVHFANINITSYCWMVWLKMVHINGMALHTNIWARTNESQNENHMSIFFSLCPRRLGGQFSSIYGHNVLPTPPTSHRPTRFSNEAEKKNGHNRWLQKTTQRQPWKWATIFFFFRFRFAAELWTLCRFINSYTTEKISIKMIPRDFRFAVFSRTRFTKLNQHPLWVCFRSGDVLFLVNETRH